MSEHLNEYWVRVHVHGIGTDTHASTGICASLVKKKVKREQMDVIPISLQMWAVT